MHKTGHVKSLQSFAFTLSDLDPHKHLHCLPVRTVIDFCICKVEIAFVHVTKINYLIIVK